MNADTKKKIEEEGLRSRFLRNILIGEKNICWNYRGTVKTNGYGEIKFRGKNVKAHRVSIFVFSGEWPNPEMCVCHKCDNPTCINPDHLFIGTHQDNMTDRNKKGRTFRHIGALNGGAKLTEEQAREIKKTFKVTGPNKSNKKELAKKFGVSTVTVKHIAMGLIWKHL